jgi:hypothetical protein
MVDTIVAFVSGASEALVVDRAMEIVHLEDHFGAGMEAAIDRGHEDDDGR